MRIGLYGGSFDPVHYGHLNVARQALEELRLDRLIVLPAHVSPFKSDAPSADGVLGNRLARIRAAFGTLERTVVDTRELDRGGVSYAIDTVREIRAEHAAELAEPGAALYFVLGEDSVAGLPRWKDVDALRALCEFRAYPRTRESSSEIRALFAGHGVVRNPDAKLAAAVEEGVLRKGGFCPCRLPKRPEFFCPCDEFKAQLRDDAFHGPCHCRLYLKP